MSFLELEEEKEKRKAYLLTKLFLRRRWGGSYEQVQKITKEKPDKKLLKELFKEDLIIFHKKGATVSLNPKKQVEIMKLIKKYKPF